MHPTLSSSGRPYGRLGSGLYRAFGLAIGLALLPTAPAFAEPNVTFHLEPAVAVWLDQPQNDRFTPGFYGAARVDFGLGRVFALQASYALLEVPAGKDFTDFGTAQFILGGARIRPLAMLDPDSRSNTDGLFVDVDLGYVRTGDLNRFGFDAGIGYGFAITPGFSIGPVLRYTQIVQKDNVAGIDPNDAQFLSFGLDFGFGPARKAKVVEESEPVAVAPAPEPVAPPPPITAVVEPCADADSDGVCDEFDHCPQQIGPVVTLGCPIDPCTGVPLVVLVQFEQNSAELPAHKAKGPQAMDPVLDAVAAAIGQNPVCRVCIVGHASEEGTATFNQELSVQRASAVGAYLAAHGVEASRIPQTGQGERCNLMPDASLPLNRRVEFLRLDEGASCPTGCVE